MEKTIIFLAAFLLIITFAKAQKTNAVLFSDISHVTYFVGTSEPSANWNERLFDDSEWEKDTISVIGHGYGDSGYVVIDSNATSMYLRCPFTIENIDFIKDLSLIVDFDDAYVAYINGFEVARINIDTAHNPAFDATATRSHVSEFVSELTRPVLGVYLDKTVLDSCLINGDNILSIHVIDDSLRSGLFVIPYLFNLTDINFEIYNDLSRYKRLVEIDSTNLPLLIMETDQYGIAYDQSIWTTARLGIVNNKNGRYNKPTDVFNEYNGLISIRSRGQSSRDFSKKSYRFELINNSGADSTISLLEMPKESDWILFGPYTDKSQIRNKLAYDLGARLGHYQPRSRFCELVINGKDEGLYMITEQIKRDKNRVDISKLKTTDINGYDVTGGYIFKYDKTDQNSKIRIKSREIVYPDILQPEQEAYLRNYFTTYDSVLKSNDFMDPYIGFRRYASDSSLVDFMIITEIIKNADSYLFSTYLHKNRDDKDGRTKFGPMWDYDLGFGNTIFQEGNKTDGWQWDINKPMNLTRYLQDPKLVELLQNRWWELRETTYSNDSIFALFDELVEQIREVRIRNYEIWPIIDKTLFYPGYNVYTYEAEVEYMRTWMETRLNWIDDNIDDIYYELKLLSTDDFHTDYNFSSYPNPFDEQLRIILKVDEQSDVRVDFYNMMGQNKYSNHLPFAEGIIDIHLTDNEISRLSSGIYIIKLTVNSQTVKIDKVIKK